MTKVYVPSPSSNNVHSNPITGVNYSPYLGQNPKTFIEPIIVPKAFDNETWTSPGYVRSGINRKTNDDITELDDHDGHVLDATPYYKMYQKQKGLSSNVESKKGTDISKLTNTMSRQSNGTKNYSEKFSMNLKQTPINSLTNNRSSARAPPSMPRYQGQTYSNGMTKGQQYTQDQIRQINETQRIERYNVAPTTSSSKKGTDIKDLTGYVGETQTNDYSVKPQYYPEFSSINNGIRNEPQSDIEGFPFETREGVLLSPTPSGAYTEKELMQPPRNLYLQSIEPNLYSYSDVTYPINANLGISYTPEMPPRIKDQILTQGQYPYDTIPLYHRLDPQLIRDNQIPGRAEELPTRSPYSAKYSDYEAASGTVDYNNIYDGRFSSYGSPYRSYADIDTAQVRYYYGDINAYRAPNFIIRNKVDHVEFRNDNGSISNEYPREVSLDDLKDRIAKILWKDKCVSAIVKCFL